MSCKVVERFLRKAKKDGVNEGYVARYRRAWWSVGLRPAAPILATYMARRPPAFVRNLAEARHINIAHGLYPRVDLSMQHARCSSPPCCDQPCHSRRAAPTRGV